MVIKAIETTTAEQPQGPFGDGVGAVELGQAFSDALTAQLQNVGEAQGEAAEKTRTLLSGGDIELHNVMLAVERMDLQFQLLVSVRNRALEAFQEIMRMQI